MKHLILLVFILTQGCTLFGGGASEAIGPTGFAGFPKRFTAIQALVVIWKGKEETVIASLRREDHEFRVTFLHAAFQTPLLELKNFGPEDARTRYFVDKERLPFQPKMILDAIVSLYEANEFTRVPGNPESEPVLQVHTDAADYRLAEIKRFGTCPFPARVELAFNATEGEKLPQVLPRLRVETKELDCK